MATKQVDTNPKTKEAAPRKKKSSLPGDLMFASFLIGYGLLMAASFQGLIPVQPGEVITVEEGLSWSYFMRDHWYIPVVLSVLYLIFCFGGQAYFKNHPGYDKELRMPLAWWSLFLAVFSLAGSLRTVPVLTGILMNNGVEYMICADSRHDWLHNNPAGFWTLWFCLSKIPELIDTFFIVFRKKELIMLHWYHHFTVMLFCWQAWMTTTINGIIFAAMNLSVHTVMYTFYALTALGYRPTRFAMMITVGQIVQMIVGTAVTTYVCLDKLVWHPVTEWDLGLEVPEWFYNPSKSESLACHVTSGNAFAGFLMYGSYLFFFVAFFINAYCKPKKTKAE